MEQRLIEYLANACWQLPLLAVGAWMLVRVARMGAAAQHRVWVAVLALGLLLPFYGWQRTGVAPGGKMVASSPGLYLGESFHTAEVTRGMGGGGRAVGFDWPALSTRSRRVEINATVAEWVMVLFFAVALFGLFRIVVAWRVARRLVRDSLEVAETGRMRRLIAESSRRLGVKAPQIRRSREIAGPVVVGAREPVLLLPENFADFADTEIMAALCHEMAHIRRRDYAGNLACEATALTLRWHPVTHGVQRRIRSTREMACDAMAAAAMESQTVYANCLLSLAQSMVLGPASTAASAAAGLFNGNALEERMMRLMQREKAMSARARVVRGVAGVAAMAMTVGVAAAFHLAPAMAQTTGSTTAQDAPIAGPTGGVTDGVKAIAPDKNAKPEIKVAPVVNVTSMVKVSPEIRLLPKVIQTTPETPTEPAQGGSGNGTGAGAGEGAGKSSGAGSQHRTYAIVNGQVRELSPEERRRVEAQLAEAQTKIAETTAKINSPEFKQQMEKAQCDVAEAAAKMNSAEFQKQMAEAQKQVAAAAATMNSPEFKEEMEKAQREAAKMNSAEFQKQMANAQKQMTDAMAKMNSPEFKQQMEKAQRDVQEAAAKMNSAEFQKQMADAQKQVADAMARMKAEQEKQQ